MTVSSSNSSTAHVTNSTVSVYDFNFKIFNAEHLSVTITFEDETSEHLILGSDYNVFDLDRDEGGNITLTTNGIAKAGNGNTLTILRDMPFLQEIDFVANGKLPPEMIERQSDMAAMERQQLLEIVGRVPISEPGAAPISSAEIRKAVGAIASTVADVATLRQDVKANTQGLSTVSDTVTGLATAVNKNTSDISAFYNSYTNLRDTVARHDNSITHLEDDIVNNISPKVAANSIAIDELDADLSGLSIAITKNSGDIAVNGSDISRLKTRVTVLEELGGIPGGGDGETPSTDLTEVTVRVEALETGLTNVSAKATSAHELASMADTAANNALSSAGNNATDITSLSSRLTKLENKPQVNGEDIGSEKMWAAITPPEGWLDESRDLGLLPRTLYPDLWVFALTSGNLLDDATWQANKTTNGTVPSFSTGDGATTFRIPLLRKVFIRAADTDSGLNVGNFQADSMLPIAGQWTLGTTSSYINAIAGTGAAATTTTTFNYFNNTTPAVAGAKMPTINSALLGTRYNGTEVRPVTAVRLPIIKAFNVAVIGDSGDDNGSVEAVQDRGILHIQEQTASGVSGGTFTLGAWRSRSLNTLITNTIEGAIFNVSLAQIILPAGEYIIDASAIGYAVSISQARLYDMTNFNSLLLGDTAYHPTGNASSRVLGTIKLTEAIELDLQHRCSATKADTGFGMAASFGERNIFSQLFVRRIA